MSSSIVTRDVRKRLTIRLVRQASHALPFPRVGPIKRVYVAPEFGLVGVVVILNLWVLVVPLVLAPIPLVFYTKTPTK